METKICNACKQDLPFDDFNKYVNGKNGLAPRCRKCINSIYTPTYKQKLERLPVNEGEVWKDVVGYEGFYMVSNMGSVKNLARKRKVYHGGEFTSKEYLLRQSLNKFGYLNVVLQRPGSRRKSITVHRLVAIAFIINESNFPQVNHINKNKQDNSVINLEWVDNRENVSFRYLGSKEITSEYVGVHLDKKTNKWVGAIRINGKTIYLGSYVDEVSASDAYKDALIKYGLTNKYA